MESKKDYNTAMIRIGVLMKAGEKNLTDAQADELRTLALAANSYEKSIYEAMPIASTTAKNQLRKR